jgi:hypothetical protein
MSVYRTTQASHRNKSEIVKLSFASANIQLRYLQHPIGVVDHTTNSTK